MVLSNKNKSLSKEISDFFLKHFIDDTSHMAQTWAKDKSKPASVENTTWRAVKRGKNPEFFTEDDFLHHFFGDNPYTLKGAYSIGPDGTCKVGTIDIDGSHGRELADASDRNTHAVDRYESLLEVCAKYGVRPFRFTSKSGTGRHLRFAFGYQAQPSEVRQFLRALCREACLPDETEVFPKQDSKDGDGSQVALPGGHWWNKEAKRRNGGSAAWLLDDESCEVPFDKWPAELRKGDILMPERFAGLMAALRETGCNKDGKPLFDPPAVTAGKKRRREPRSDVAPGDPTYEGWLPSDVEDFLSEHGFNFKRQAYKDGFKFILDRCPWNAEHSDPEDNTGVAALIDGAGVLGFKCHHAHCENRKWRDFRQVVDPTWKRRERPCGGKKFERIYSSSQLRAEAKKKRLAELEEAERARAALRADIGSPGQGDRGFARLGSGVSAATVATIAVSTERMREPGEDEDVALEEAHLALSKARLEAGAEKLRQARFEHRKKSVLSRPWRDHIVATSWREKYGLYSPLPRMGDVDPETGKALRPDDVNEEQGAKIDKLNVAHQHTRSCRALTKVLLGKSGKRKVVPYACDRSGCCVQCAEESARDQAEWAEEHWDHEMVTLVEARNDETEPRNYRYVEALRKAAAKVVKIAEKGPKKPRKKRKKKGESLLGASADAALGATAAEPEGAEKKKFPWRYVNGCRRSVIIGPAEMHAVIGARFQPGGPKTAAGYAGDVVKCSESYGLSVVTSRVVTKAEAIKILFGHEVGDDGKTDPMQFADWKSVWMEPSVELLARDRAGEAHLRTPCPSDPDGEAKWEADLDRLTLRCFAHPYVQVKKKKRTSGNAPGKVEFSLPTPAELRAWKKERRIRENPDLAQEPDEEYKEVELRYYNKPFFRVDDHKGKDPWACARECMDKVGTFLSRLGDPTFDIDADNRKQAAFVPMTDAEMYKTQHVRMRPAHGCAPESPRAAHASAG